MAPQRYPTDLTEAQWAQLAPCCPHQGSAPTAPRAAVTEHIQDPVEHLSQVYAPRPAPGLHRGQQRGEHPPLGRGQIAGIWFPSHILVVYAKSPHFSHRLLVYRNAYHVLGALVQGALDIAPPRALALVNVFSLTGAAALLMAIGLRYFRSWNLGLLSAIIFVYGGSLEWLLAIPVEAWRWSDLGSGLPLTSEVRPFYHYAVSGHFAAGNPLDMLIYNPSISFGYPVWLLTAWLYVEARTARCRRGYLTLALVGVLLTFLFSANEILFGALAAAMIAVELGCFLLRLRQQQGSPVASRPVLALCLIFTSLVGNALLGGSVLRAFFDPDAGATYGLVLNSDHLGQLVEAPSKGGRWAPIASTSFVLQSVFLLPLGPLLVALALIRGVGGTITALFGLSAGFALGGGALVYPEAFPPDSYRFSQAAFSIWPATAVLLVGGLLQRWTTATGLNTPIGARVLAGVLALILVGGHLIWLQALSGPGAYSQSSQPPPARKWRLPTLSAPSAVPPASWWSVEQNAMGACIKTAHEG